MITKHLIRTRNEIRRMEIQILNDYSARIVNVDYIPAAWDVNRMCTMILEFKDQKELNRFYRNNPDIYGSRVGSKHDGYSCMYFKH